MTAMRAGVVAMAGVLAASAWAADLPLHPRELDFPELEFEPPSPADYRTELGGVPVYLAPSSELPLVQVTFTFRGGGYLEPADKVGLAPLTGALMRTGGAGSLSPEALDEEFAFLAANAAAFIGDSFATCTLDTLSSNFDESFALFMDMVRRPAFDADRLEVFRGQSIEAMRQRNDDGVQVLLREWGFLMFGQDDPAARQPTLSTIESITRDDIAAFHARVIQPGNLIVAVSGDFEPSRMLETLAAAMEGWAAGERMPPHPGNTHEPEPGIYYIDKPQTQGQVVIGRRGITRDHPDAIPVRVMNDILGGSGFTSRITNRVRSDEGLAYTAGSAFRNRVTYPGDFISYYFSKVPSVALAGRTVFEEINRIRDTEVSTDELDTVKNNIIDTFPRTFESKSGTLSVFVNDEWTGRDPDFWGTFRDRVEGVDASQVQRVAREYLDPSRMVMLVVGPWDGIRAGNTASEDDPRRVATMDDLPGGDQAARIPTRDPLTLQPASGG